MTLLENGDDIRAMRNAESQTLGRVPLTPRQRWTRVLVALVVLAGLVGAVAQARKPDPYFTVTLIPWSQPVVSPNGREVTVSYLYGGCANSGVRTVVRETPTQVAITLVQVSAFSDRGGACPLMAFRGKTVALLGHPLGSRKLVNGRCSERVEDAAVPKGCDRFR